MTKEEYRLALEHLRRLRVLDQISPEDFRKAMDDLEKAYKESKND